MAISVKVPPHAGLFLSSRKHDSFYFIYDKFYTLLL